MGQSIDLAFVIDTTGSMGDDIAAVKANASEIIDAAFGDPDDPNDVRFSLIGYNDPSTDVVLSFTDQDELSERKTAITAAINSLSVSGGGDFPEVVFAGLEDALDGSAGEWREDADIRKIVLFGDAPPKDNELADRVFELAKDLGAELGTGEAGTSPIPVKVCAIAIGGNSEAEAAFTEIASETGGDFVPTLDSTTVVDTLIGVVSDTTDPDEDPTDRGDEEPAGSEGVVNGTDLNDEIFGEELGTPYVDEQGDFVSDGGPDDSDTVLAGPGDDLVQTGAGNDEVYGGAGKDTVEGGEGNDIIVGNHGKDILIGGDGDDVIRDWSGWSSIFGESGNDTINAGNGRDTIIGGEGDDLLTGGKKADIFRSKALDGQDTITDFEVNNDLLVFDGITFGTAAGETDPAAFLTRSSFIEGADLVITFDDTYSVRLQNVVDESNPDTSVTDFVSVLATRDDLVGSDEGDELEGTEVADDIEGGAGDDVISGNDADDHLKGGAGNDNIFGGEGRDDINGGIGDDSLDGGADNDYIVGNAGNDTLDGGSGDDVIRGGRGDNTLIGGTGNDKVIGGRDVDNIFGSEGDDELSGGDGDDIFTMDEDSGNDVITDFELGSDVLNLSDYALGEDSDEDAARAAARELLEERGTIQEGKNLFLELDDGRSIQLLDVVDEEGVGDEASDYEDIFFT